MRHAPTCKCKTCALIRLKASHALADARQREEEREIKREEIEAYENEFWAEYMMGKD